MHLKKITLIIAILYILAGTTEAYRYFNGTSVLLFKDYPVAIGAWILMGVLFLLGYLMFSKYKQAKPILVFAGLLSLCINGFHSIYNAYVGFGNSFEAFGFLVPMLLILIGIVFWYIRAVLRHDRTAL